MRRIDESASVWAGVCVCGQWVRHAGGGSAGAVVQAGRDHGHEAADLPAEELEQLHLSEAGRVVAPPAVRGSHLHTDAALGHVDGPPEHAQELLVQGTAAGAPVSNEYQYLNRKYRC